MSESLNKAARGAWAILLAAVVGCNVTVEPQTGPPDTETPTPHTFNIRVARQVDQFFSSDAVDQVFAEASALLLSDDFSCPDVTCPSTMARSGGVDTFNVAPATLTSEAQLDAVFAYSADLKIVNLMVGVCGASGNGDVSVVLGCAFTGGSAVLVHDAPSDVWAHEWGHVQGLPHRDDCATNLMHTFELQTDAVNTTERAAFLSPTPGAFGLRAMPVHEAAKPAAHAEAELPVGEWIDTVLPKPYLAGIPQGLLPYDRGAELVDALLDRWPDLEAGPERTNAIRTLGLLGDPIAVDVLIALLEKPAEQSAADLAEAVLALGRLAGADGSESAIAFLTAHTTPDAWADEDGEMAISEAVVARLAVLSLGITEHPQGLAHLQAMRTQADALRSTDPWMITQIDEALARSGGAWANLRAAVADDRQP